LAKYLDVLYRCDEEPFEVAGYRALLSVEEIVRLLLKLLIR